MKERPIMFNAPMVRAILAGMKTQTRRVAKLNDSGRVKLAGSSRNWHCEDPDAWQACPYGVPGDRLWVRETWGDCTPGADALIGIKWDSPWYRADSGAYGLLGHDGEGPVYVEDVKWRPSIHMPRWASRITLEITGVRVERVRDITVKDCRAEGGAYSSPIDIRAWYRDVWESIYGPGSWDANWWVWVIDFKRAAGGEG